MTVSVTDPVSRFLEAIGPSVIERVDIPPSPARFAALPETYRGARIAAWLGKKYGSTDIYLHQARALEKIAAGENVVVSTGTASGKSLIFMAAVLHMISKGAGTALVLYPQKALGGDQLIRWRDELASCGLSPDLVAEITGAVPINAREHILENARIILATPDVLHCWMMRMIQAKSVRAFLRLVEFIVIDEAHALDGVFGSQFAFFFRRLRAARQALTEAAEPQIIATTATLHDPVGHLSSLTGMAFGLVDEVDNGAPHCGRTLLHIEGPDFGSPAEKFASEVISRLAETMPKEVAAIGFADSRQGVERIVRRIERTDVLPYRGGYNPDERRNIERALRRNELRAIFSTSACELGIDIPQFAYGLNVGVPPSRKSLRQRSGRVGRAQPGVFAVMAPRSAFTQLGSSLEEYALGPVEPSPLYLGNKVIQFQQACCYLREGAYDEESPILDPALNWPDGFEEALAMARPGAKRPAILDEVALAGLDSPHLAFLLRSMQTASFVLKLDQTGEQIGVIDHEKALREAYPGGTYIHFGVPYRVIDWRNSSYEHSIKLRRLKYAEQTQPIIRFQVGASTHESEVIEQNLLHSARGVLAECQMRVVESVEGYRIGNSANLYKDLRETDRRLSRKQREFISTGILLCINEPWFEGDGEHQLVAREAVAKALSAILCREFGVVPSDIRTAHTGIAMHSTAGARRISDAIVIFDSIAGGLRLSAPIFAEFNILLERLKRGAALAGSEALLSETFVERLREWSQSIRQGIASTQQLETKPGMMLVYAPGSKLSIRLRGQLVERTIAEPQLLATADGEQLMYRYEAGAGVQGWVAHDQIDPAGNDWARAFWDPLTGALEALSS